MSLNKAVLYLVFCLLLLALAVSAVRRNPRSTPQKPCPTCRVQTIIEIPPRFRQKNWMAQNGTGGSCVHASVITLLQWQGNFQMATWWRSNFEGGEEWGPLVDKLNASGVRWAGTCNAPVQFLEWACANRLGAVIEYSQNQMARHALVIVDLTPTHAILLDNNNPRYFRQVSRDRFLQIWQGQSFACAFTLVNSPPPPFPSHSVPPQPKQAD